MRHRFQGKERWEMLQSYDPARGLLWKYVVIILNPEDVLPQEKKK